VAKKEGEMSETKFSKVLGICTNIAVLGGAVAIITGAGTWAYSTATSVATKDFHISDLKAQNEYLRARLEEQKQFFSSLLRETLEPVRLSAENAEAGVIADRLRNLLDIRCRSGTVDLDAVIDEQLARYQELAGRPFGVGTCVDGTRVDPF
jgi:hypothetical protein